MVLIYPPGHLAIYNGEISTAVYVAGLCDLCYFIYFHPPEMQRERKREIEGERRQEVEGDE